MLIRQSHGHAQVGKVSPTYRCWTNMKTRCQWPRHPQWKDYGGRGIEVCHRWQVFDNFLEDMGEKPSGLCLDRIDNDGHYEPSNCRWVSYSDNNKNKRARPRPMHCKRGHLFTFETSEWRTNGTRRCKICESARRKLRKRGLTLAEIDSFIPPPS